MKYLILGLSIIVLLLFVAACSSDKPADSQPAAQQETHQMVPKAIQVTSVSELSTPMDPVCGMTLDDAAIHSAVEVDGKKIGFCCDNCAAKFVENPKMYGDKIQETHNHEM